MGVDWYNMIARKNGGYRSTAEFTIEGSTAEDLFENTLVSMLPQYSAVLDAGCGHGDFTLKMGRSGVHIIGFDNSIEMITLANSLHNREKLKNVEFVYTTTKTEMPFADEQFDLIYSRRGPTSIINHSHLLKSGGTIMGIHSGNLDVVIQRLEVKGYRDIEMNEYRNAMYYFSNEQEYAKFLSDIPGNPDFTVPEKQDELRLKIQENMINGRIGVQEYKYIWKAIKS
ncbi:class I SAM-dependent methyltransferase [Paenibacillus sp. N1-5-1-14]|uniref:class I SAM-dependent methyltransferase n=1 Tax=Paenibacillus radicibacter TaxID=2972488 RepID=UPI0021590748|nr:class I SAM-dependent methyltransferase [Paenibacillus radicibacter]MCR8644424.1 class I SAM-dependent methyltransferase [Paenibacillus radicibacter]